MKIKLFKHTSDELRATIVVPPDIDSGKIILFMYLAKDNIQKIEELPYEKNELSYVFKLEDGCPRNLEDLDYLIEIRDGNKVEKTRKLNIFKNLPHHLSGIMKKVRHDFDIVSRKYNGSIAYFFKRLKTKRRCPECWDDDLQASDNTNCKVCGGTGMIIDYSNPYKTVCGPLIWRDDAYSIDAPGKAQPNTSVQLSALGDLPLATDDIVYYVATGDFLRVASRTVSEVQTSVVLQSFTANVIPSEYVDTRICQKKLEEKGII